MMNAKNLCDILEISRPIGVINITITSSTTINGILFVCI